MIKREREVYMNEITPWTHTKNAIYSMVMKKKNLFGEQMLRLETEEATTSSTDY